MNTTTMSHTNLEYLKLMSDGDQEMEKVMLEMLLDELPSEFEKMKTLHAAQEWKELSKVSHKMKSTLAFIGNADMTGANLKIEQLTKQESLPSADEVQVIGAMMEQFGEVLPEVMGELREVFEGY